MCIFGVSEMVLVILLPSLTVMINLICISVCGTVKAQKIQALYGDSLIEETDKNGDNSISRDCCVKCQVRYP